MTPVKPRASSVPPPEGRTKGTLNPRTLDQIRKKREHIYAALLRSALAGDAVAGRTCLELIGDLPREDVISLERGAA